MAKGNFEQFLEALGAFESAKPSGDSLQYIANNPNTNATGKYQFTEVIFADLGYYNAIDNNLYDGVFNGTWTGKNGVTSLNSWTVNPAAQETAIREAFSKNYGYVNSGLSAKGITSIDGYLSNAANQGAKTVKYYKLNKDRTDFEKDASGNRIIYTQQITISLSGILAGAHLRGGSGVAEVLGQLNNKSSIDFTASQFDLSYYKTNLLDEINTPIFKYLDDFGNYTVTNADFTLSSYGNATNYVLYGTLNNDTINGGSGNDTINGGAGNDILIGDTANGTFGTAFKAISDYSPGQGWSSFNSFPRQVADVNGDGRADIVGFGDRVYVALGQADGTFGSVNSVLDFYNPNQGWTSNDAYPRQVADVNGDGRADIVGFGGDGVYVSLGQANGTFGAKFKAVSNYSPAQGWSSFDKFPRQVADVNGDGRADIVGFGDRVYVALGQADGTFGSVFIGVQLLSFIAPTPTTGWTSFDKYPRQLADVNGDGRADIVGFSSDDVYVALGQADGTFGGEFKAVSNYSPAQGWSSFNSFPRQVADVNGDGRADIVGFGGDAVYIALGQTNGTFGSVNRVLEFYSPNQGWSSFDQYPRELGDVNGDGAADIVGFGGDGVYVALANSGKDILTGGLGQDTLTGGPGADRFDYRNLADSVLGSFDVITDFNAKSGNDLFVVSNARSVFNNVGTVATLDAAGIAAKLTNTTFTANSAAQFSFGSRTFVGINDTTAGFDPTKDAIIEVTGLAGTLGLNNFTTSLA